MRIKISLSSKLQGVLDGLLTMLQSRDNRVIEAISKLELKMDENNKTVGVAIADLKAKVATLVTASDSATVLILGFKERLDAAIAAAATQGVSPEELAALHELSATIGTEAGELAAAVAANTPGTDTQTGTGTDTITGGAGGDVHGDGLSLSPLSITGVSGETVSGSFSTTNGQAPYSYDAASDDIEDLNVATDGTYSGTFPAAAAGTVSVTVTDAAGANQTFDVSVSIS